MPKIVTKTQKIILNLSGSFDQNNLKSLFFSDDGEAEGIPKNKILWNNVRDLQVVLVLKNQNNTYILRGTGDIKSDEENLYKIKIYAEYKSETPVSIDDSYYLTGIIGGKVDDKGDRLTLDMSHDIQKDFRELDIPVAFPWRKIVSDNIRSDKETFVDIPNLSFNPIGNLIGFDISSEVYDPVDIVGMNIKTNVFSSGGFFDLKNSVPKDGEYLDYNVDDNTNTINYTLHSKNPTDLRLEKNQNVRYFYTWVMGKKSNGTEKRELSVGFDVKPVCRDAISNMDKDKIKVLHTPDFDRWTPSQIPSFTHGKPFFIKTKLQSTNPIITEVYHKSEWDNRQHCTVIEIYNPSSKPIDMSDYYIARSVAGNVYHGYDKAYTDFGNALLYPVYMRNGHTVRTPNDMTTEKSDMKLDFKPFYNSQITQYIQPGKTVLLLGDAYHKEFTTNGGDLLIDPKRGVGPYVKDKCWGELKSIQYIVCSDKTPRCELTPTPSNDADKIKPHRSHILKFYPYMGFVLLKKVTSEPFDKEVSDIKTGGKNRFLAVDSYGPYFNEKVGENPLTQYKDERFFVIRYDGVVFPSGGNYYPDQWGYIDYAYMQLNTDITSIGARYMSWKNRIVIPDMPAGN